MANRQEESINGKGSQQKNEQLSLLEETFQVIRRSPTNRVNLADPKFKKHGAHWARIVAEEIVSRFPGHEVYTSAAGISPSGVVHFGNFRDVMTAALVIQQLREMGKETRFIFSWDDYDRFRKVPADVDPSFKQYLGRPLCEVPDPLGKLESYARRYEVPFEDTMKRMGIELEYRYQGEEYRSGKYNEAIITSLINREKIADILLAHMSEKGIAKKGIDPIEYRETFYPIAVYSKFSGTDETTVLDFDGASQVLYRCNVTGELDRIDLREKRDTRVKLAWKIDWPMRWKHEQVVFEPGGSDHASPNGSYDVSARVCRDVFDYAGPLFVGYAFIGLQGIDGKMSGSKGGALTPGDLIEVYEPEIVKWLYARKKPDQEFQIAFDTDVVRTYDEFDRSIQMAKAGKLTGHDMTAIAASVPQGFLSKPPAPNFRYVTGLGQCVNWNEQKAEDIERELLREKGGTMNVEALHSRLERARRWIEEYNPDVKITMRDTLNRAYISDMSVEAKGYLRKLYDKLADDTLGIAELELFLYSIPKLADATPDENKVRQRAFFKDVYQLLLGVDTGPRLATLLWATDRARTRELLNVDTLP